MWLVCKVSILLFAARLSCASFGRLVQGVSRRCMWLACRHTVLQAPTPSDSMSVCRLAS
jgi:hypothetical protein